MNGRSVMALLSICVLIFLLDIEYSAVNLALKTISEETDVALGFVQWVLSSYVLVWGALILPAGRFGNIYGQRTTLFVGLFLFLLGSAVAGISGNIDVLIFGRIIQGVGAAVFSTPCYSIIFSIMPDNRKGIALGIISAVGSLGLAVGPTISGLILDYLNWRWIFWLNLPLGILSYLIGLYSIPKDSPVAAHEKIDWVGAFSLATGVSLLIYSLNQIEAHSVFSMPFAASALASGLLLIFFWRWNAKSPWQTLPDRLVKHKTFVRIIGAAFLASVIFADVLVMIGIYLQNTLQFSSSTAGFIFLAMSVPLGIFSPIGGKLTDRFPGHIPVIAGTVLMFFSTALMIFFTQETPLFYVLMALGMNGMGCGLMYPALNTLALKVLAPQDVSYGSAAFTMAVMLGNTSSVVFNTSLCVIMGKIKLETLMPHLSFSLTEVQKDILKGLIAHIDHGADQLIAFPATMIPALTSLLDHAFLRGFSATMIAGTVCGFAILVISWRRI